MGRDVLTGERVKLASYLGRPLLIAAWSPSIETSWRFLQTLDAFANRHPDVPVLSVVRFHPTDAAKALRQLTSQFRGLSFPTIAIDDFHQSRAITWDVHERFGLDVLALDAEGHIAAELATPKAPNHPWDYGLLTQQALEDALAAAGG